MKKLLFLLIFISLVSRLAAQHTVSGLVTDKSDNTHLIDGVLIYIPEFNRTDLTKEGGTYILRNVGIGIIHLQFTKRGYRSMVKTISTADSATVINIEMEPTSFPSEEITDVSNLTTFSENTPFNDEVFSAPDLNRKGSINITSALADQPGIDQVSLGNFNKVVIHGLSFNHVLSYQSGMRIENNSWNELQDNGMVEDGTDQVEIIKGPASLMYGGNAMGGVMIFKDEKMPVAGSMEGDVNLGLINSTAGIQANAGVKASTSKGIFYSIRFGEKSHTSYIQGEGDSVRKNTEEKDYAYNSGLFSQDAKGVFGISKKWGQSKMTVSYLKNEYELIRSLTDSEISVMNGNTERDRISTTPFIRQTTYNVASENILLLKKSQVDVNVSWQQNERKDFEPDNFEEGNLADQHMTISTLGYDVKYISDASGKYGYTAGTQGFFQDEKNSLNLAESASTATNSAGAYIIGRYDLADINLLGGLRYDSKDVKNSFSAFNKVYGHASGSAGMAWHPSKILILKVNLASGFSDPSIEQRDGYFYSYSKIITGNTALSSERNYQSDFGLEINTSDFRLKFCSYYNRIDHYIYPERVYIDNVTHLDIYSYSQADAFIKGGDFSFDVHPQQLRWINLNASYSIVRGDFRTGGNHLPGMPADKLTADIRFQSEQMNYLYHPYISIGMRAYVNQDRIYTYETPSNSYSLFDLHLGGSFSTGKHLFDITISINNILDANYFSHLSLVKNLYPVPIREMGRNVSLQVHFPFGIRQGK